MSFSKLVFLAIPLTVVVISERMASADSLCTGHTFSPNETWTTGAYYGNIDAAVHFADVDGDGKADAIVVNSNGITVRRSNGTSFLPNETWTYGAFYGSIGNCNGSLGGTYPTYFYDVTGDGKADAIAINDSGTSTGVNVRASGYPRISGFYGPTSWSSLPFYNSDGDGRHRTYFADVNGDGKVDAIVHDVNDHIIVRLSTGTSLSANADWSSGPYVGTAGDPDIGFFADSTGDGKADAIVVRASVQGGNERPPYVESNPGFFLRPGASFAPFGTSTRWTAEDLNEPQVSYPLFDFKDVNGDGKADAVLDDGANVAVRCATASGTFTGLYNWISGVYTGNIGTYLADVTGDGKADMIVVNTSGITVRRAN